MEIDKSQCLCWSQSQPLVRAAQEEHGRGRKAHVEPEGSSSSGWRQVANCTPCLYWKILSLFSNPYYWSTIASAVGQSESARPIHTSLLLWAPSHAPLFTPLEHQRALSRAPCVLQRLLMAAILCMIVCTFQCYSPSLYHPPLPPLWKVLSWREIWAERLHG